jgi:parallel beta-helix repeat protein
MKKVFLFAVMISVLSLATGGRAAVHNVTSEVELRNALSTAENNGEADTINIAPGIFDTSGTTFSYFCPPGENYPLTIAGAGAGNTVLDGNGSNQVLNINTMGLANDGAAHVTVSGISFQNGNTGGLGGGLYVGTSRADITVEHCAFGGNTANHGGGAYALSSGPPSGNVTFTNNTFSGNTANTNGGGAFAGSDSGVTFTNNTFSGNTVNRDGGGFFISLFENAATGNIYNNIAWGNTATRDGDDILVDDDGDGDLTGATVNLYNNDYGPDANDFVIRVGDNLSQGSNIHTDPLLVDPATGDFHLQAGSPCIDNGTATAPSLPGTDCDGEPRTIGFSSSTPIPFHYPDFGVDGGCFITTAAYGSALSNEVTVFRQFRDDYLLTNELGRAFVSAYYEYSPRLADYIAEHPMLRRIVRIGLYPILELSKWCIEESGPERPSKKSE